MPAPPGAQPGDLCRRRRGGRVVPGVRPDLSAARLGRARRRRDLERCAARRSTTSSIASAGNRSRRIGITNQRETAVAWNRRTGRRTARPSSGRTAAPPIDARRCARAGHLPLVRETTGLVLDPYFSASKFEWLLPTATSRSTTTCARHDRLVADLEPHRRRRPRHRCHQRQPDDAVRHPHAAMVARAVRPVRRADFGAPGGVAVERSVRRRHPRRPAAPAGIPISGVAGDQQAALFGQACFTPGMAKNTYGTGSFVLLNVGSSCPPPTEGMLTTVAWQLVGRHRCVCAGGRDLRHRRGHPMAARRTRTDRIRCRDRAPRRRHPRQRWRVRRAGIRRPRQPVVGSLRAWHHRRHHPRHIEGASRPRRGGGDGLPDPRRRRGDGRRQRHHRSPRCESTAALP